MRCGRARPVDRFGDGRVPPVPGSWARAPDGPVPVGAPGGIPLHRRHGETGTEPIGVVGRGSSISGLRGLSAAKRATGTPGIRAPTPGGPVPSREPRIRTLIGDARTTAVGSVHRVRERDRGTVSTVPPPWRPRPGGGPPGQDADRACSRDRQFVCGTAGRVARIASSMISLIASGASRITMCPASGMTRSFAPGQSSTVRSACSTGVTLSLSPTTT